MNRQKADELFKLYGRPAFVPKDGKGTAIVFARQSSKDITEIEKMTDKKLIEEWKGLVWMNHIYGQISLNELQRIDLIELEMNERKGINNEELKDWFDKAEEKQQKNME